LWIDGSQVSGGKYLRLSEWTGCYIMFGGNMRAGPARAAGKVLMFIIYVGDGCARVV